MAGLLPPLSLQAHVQKCALNPFGLSHSIWSNLSYPSLTGRAPLKRMGFEDTTDLISGFSIEVKEDAVIFGVDLEIEAVIFFALRFCHCFHRLQLFDARLKALNFSVVVLKCVRGKTDTATEIAIEKHVGIFKRETEINKG